MVTASVLKGRMGILKTILKTTERGVFASDVYTYCQSHRHKKVPGSLCVCL